MKRTLVVGSNGWVAGRLIAMLQDRHPGIFIRGFDITPCPWNSKISDFVRGDLSNFQDVKKAVESIDTVFHVAALVNGSAELLHKVNVVGVKNVIAACTELGVQRLIYTSSASVVYNGEPIHNGDETLPYCKGGLDPYNETKSIAEAAILKANGTKSGNGILSTCAIRPHSIYGPGDPISWPQMISNGKAGKLKWKLTEDVHESSYTFIDNLCHCEILAATKLCEKDAKVGGNAYNVSDGVDGLFWSNLYEVSEISGVPRSQYGRMSLIPIFPILFKVSWLFWYLGYPLGTFTPYVLLLATTTHTYNISKAQRDLGYQPVEPPLVSWQKTKKSFENYQVRVDPPRPKLSLWLFIVAIFNFVGGIQYFYSSFTPSGLLASATPMVARLFGAWTLLSSFIQFQCAANVRDKNTYGLAVKSFAIALGVYGYEVFISGSIPLQMAMTSLIFSALSFLWMKLAPPS